jgi:cytochrome bd-type quinol oxidase subunit 2
MEAIDFVTDYKATGAVFELYQDVEDGRYTGLIAPAIAILVLFFALLAYPVAWLGRKLDHRASQHAHQRRTAWLAVILLLGGALTLGLAVIQTSSRSVAMLAIGLVGPTAWIAPLILLGVLLAFIAFIQVVRKPSDPGTVTGVGMVLAAGITLCVSLTLLGLLF